MPLPPAAFLWGASAAPHQIAGNDVNSDWWVQEFTTTGMEPRCDALDSYHRFAKAPASFVRTPNPGLGWLGSVARSGNVEGTALALGRHQ